MFGGEGGGNYAGWFKGTACPDPGGFRETGRLCCLRNYEQFHLAGGEEETRGKE